MRIKIDEVGNGLHPSEVVVQVRSVEGPERLIVDRRAIEYNTIDVGYPVAERNGNLLIELPRESLRGAWRVWVSREAITGELATA